MEDDATDIQLLITRPADEANLYECLGGVITAFADDSAMNAGIKLAVQKIVTGHEVEMYLDPTMLGCFYAPWRCGRRGARMRSRSWRQEVIKKSFGPQYPCTSGDGKCTSRKNNDHWTEDEMKELMDGVSEKGIGNWSKVKESYFSDSIRTAVNLKDKWRNLMRACKAKKSYKKKVNVQKATELTVRIFRHRVLAIIEAKGLDKKRRRINLGQGRRVWAAICCN